MKKVLIFILAALLAFGSFVSMPESSNALAIVSGTSANVQGTLSAIVDRISPSILGGTVATINGTSLNGTTGSQFGVTNSVTRISNAVTSNSISISVPSSLSFGIFKPGQFNYADWNTSGSQGSITVTGGNDGETSGWIMNAVGNKYMASVSQNLTEPLLIGTNGSIWNCADGTSSGIVEGMGYSGTFTISGNSSGNFDLQAAQYIHPTDVAGSYVNTITFTVSLIPNETTPTTTSATSSLNPSDCGQSVTFMANVRASGTSMIPTGTVTFNDGPTPLGTGVLNVSGNATFSTASLTAGSHSITAVYGGDANFTASTSNILTQVVNRAWPAPIVTGIFPSSGTTLGGTSVTINGSGFIGVAVVKFGTVSGNITGTPTDTQIIATSPANIAGKVDITVTTLGGTSATNANDLFSYEEPVPPVPEMPAGLLFGLGLLGLGGFVMIKRRRRAVANK